MKILLVDADSVRYRDGSLLPNLALMKLSALYKKEGHEVRLAYYEKDRFASDMSTPDRVMASCLFSRNVNRIHELQVIYPGIVCGGSGYDFKVIIPDKAEHIMPDYSLYGIGYSIGYTTRGCFRKCGFCIIPRKEGMIRHNAEISEFLASDHTKVVLLDNNFFAGPRWREHVKFLVNRSLKACITQGIDARIMTDEMALAIQTMDLHNRTFDRPTIYTAFDDLEDEVEFRRGIERLEDAGVPLRSVIVYMIVGYHTTLENNMERLNIIREYGMDPFVMRYSGSSIQDVHFSRWVNRFLYKTVPFDDYIHRVRWKGLVRKRYESRENGLDRWA